MPIIQEDRLGECEDLICKKFTFLKYTHYEDIYLCKKCYEITTEIYKKFAEMKKGGGEY